MRPVVGREGGRAGGWGVAPGPFPQKFPAWLTQPFLTHTQPRVGFPELVSPASPLAGQCDHIGLRDP